ncbi:hypothetical protein BC833DRAFT_620714 [Globomyces pollinis-pini]|nr:hypothetical protein BC833DRAFT_620714 [Globomyces pollinis-pini]
MSSNVTDCQLFINELFPILSGKTRNLNLSLPDCCNSERLQCNREKRLTEILLNHYNLTGFIPSTLSKLKLLTTLDLSDNELIGPIPDTLSQIDLIKLNLTQNQLSGYIPQSILSMKTYNSDNMKFDPHHYLKTNDTPLKNSNENEHLALIIIIPIVVLVFLSIIALLIYIQTSSLKNRKDIEELKKRFDVQTQFEPKNEVSG